MTNQKKEHILFYKILFTFMMLIIYIIGRNILLYGIDTNVIVNASIDAQDVFMQTLTGDFNNSSLFALGIWPYMLASMVAIIFVALRSINKTVKASPKFTGRITLVLTIVLGLLQAIQKSKQYTYSFTSKYIYFNKLVIILELLVGLLIVVWLCRQNEKYGIGQRSAIILVNIYTGVFTMLSGHTYKELILPIIIGVIEIPIMLLLETTEKRIPVQRVSIHSIYADKNYVAIKLNPAGIMPVMFASAVLMLPQIVLSFLSSLIPTNESIAWAAENMKLTSPFGVASYIAIIWILVICFSYIMVAPKKLSENMLKTGDSIEDIYAGKPTKKYLSGCVLRFSIYSSFILTICLGIPLSLQFYGLIEPSLVMLPCSIMMSTGLWISMRREARVYLEFEKYRPFINED